MSSASEPAVRPTWSSRVRRAQKVLRDLGPAGPWFLFACVVPIGGTVLLVATSGLWLDRFDASLGSALVFWLCGGFAAAMCLLPTHATSLLAGFLFGPALGAALAFLVVLLAATIGFFAWHRLVGERALRAMADAPRAMALHRALLGRGFWRTAWLIALVRLSPVLPFAATNLLLATFGVRALPFFTATMVGISPRALAVAWVGASLSVFDLSAEQARSNGWLTVLAVVATLSVLVVVGRAARRALGREIAAGHDGAADVAR